MRNDQGGDQLQWCMSISAAVARGVRFCDGEARDHCTREAALHLLAQLGKFDQSRGVPIAAFAGLITRRRLIRLAHIELRARLHCRVRPQRAPGRKREAAAPLCCPRCRPVVARELDRQIAACRKSDAEYAAWTRDVIIGQRRSLVGETKPRS